MDNMMNFIGMATIIPIVISVVITVVVLWFVFRMLGRIGQANQATQQLLMTGMPATATVLHLEDGGMRVNDNPMVNVLLEISTAQGTYQATVQQIIPMFKLAQVQPGQSINVKVNPSNPQHVALELR